MEEVISKEELNELIRIKGKIRGVAFDTEKQFILKEEGEGSLKKIEEALEKAGYPFEYDKMETMRFYPIGLQAATLVAIKRLFSYDGKKFEQLGDFKPRVSPFFIRLYIRYFVSVKEVIKRMDKFWKKHFTIGGLTLVEVDEKKKYLIFRCENFDFHPIWCHILKGYSARVVKMVVKKEKVSCEEVKCIYRGDRYHEYLLKW